MASAPFLPSRSAFSSPPPLAGEAGRGPLRVTGVCRASPAASAGGSGPSPNPLPGGEGFSGRYLLSLPCLAHKKTGRPEAARLLCPVEGTDQKLSAMPVTKPVPSFMPSSTPLVVSSTEKIELFQATPTEPPAPAPVADVMIPDAMYLDEDNAPMAGSMTIAAGDSYTNNGVMFSCPAGGDACEVEVMDDGSVTSTGGAATAMLTDDAMTQVAQAKQEAEEERARAALENRDRIIGKDRALEAAANLPAASAGGVPGEAAIIINRGGSGPARVTSTGYSASEDPILPNGDVWIGSRLMQTAGGNTNHLFVYTDKEPATRIQFYNWDGDATTPSLYADTVTDALTAPADSGTTITPLALDGTVATFSASVTDPTRFPQPQSAEEGSLRQNYANNQDTDGDLANGLEQVSIPGNYNGAGGRYVCTGGTTAAPCSVTVTPAGTYTNVVGTWTFIPELNSTAWIQDGGNANGGGTAVQQGEFMSFGWWLQEPTAQTGVYTFRYYADGTEYQLAAGDLASGSATYNGRAAGKFVVQEIDNTGVVDGEAGMFTAAASLTARFNGTAAGGTLQGVINGFQTDNAGVDVSGWSVTLARQTITGPLTTNVTSTGTNNDPTASGFDGATATLGDQTLHGTWSSEFFGQPSTADAYPLGVGGVFQADNESASIAGAFGARR